MQCDMNSVDEEISGGFNHCDPELPGEKSARQAPEGGLPGKDVRPGWHGFLVRNGCKCAHMPNWTRGSMRRPA